MCETARIMPRIAGVSFKSTVLWSLVRPSPRMVSLCFCGRLVPLRTRVTFNLSAIIVSLSAEIVQRLATKTRRLVGRAEHLQRLDGRVDDVVRVRGADALGEDVLHPRDLEQRPDRAAGDDARAGAGRAQQ